MSVKLTANSACGGHLVVPSAGSTALVEDPALKYQKPLVQGLSKKKIPESAVPVGE